MNVFVDSKIVVSKAAATAIVEVEYRERGAKRGMSWRRIFDWRFIFHRSASFDVMTL